MVTTDPGYLLSVPLLILQVFQFAQRILWPPWTFLSCHMTHLDIENTGVQALPALYTHLWAHRIYSFMCRVLAGCK